MLANRVRLMTTLQDGLVGPCHNTGVRKMLPFKVAPFRELTGKYTKAGELLGAFT